MTVKTFTLLSAVVANTTGSAAAIGPELAERITFRWKAAGVTTGATGSIEARMDNGDWVKIDSRTLGANGDTVIQAEGPILDIRGIISNRTDGTFTLTADVQYR